MDACCSLRCLVVDLDWWSLLLLLRLLSLLREKRPVVLVPTNDRERRRPRLVNDDELEEEESLFVFGVGRDATGGAFFLLVSLAVPCWLMSGLLVLLQLLWWLDADGRDG